jgi:hypothetical protein
MIKNFSCKTSIKTHDLEIGTIHSSELDEASVYNYLSQKREHEKELKKYT